MSPLQFYREQAAQQQLAANGAALANVRERCQRASDAWAVLAERSERADNARQANPKPSVVADRAPADPRPATDHS